ncbi:hypothetical protein [Thioclava sp. GXIMD4215]|uniref:hypothetical protein n=1 Tax=Thioclava sp. GXIMD4215 TaxID=3131928 RepID=UPI003254D9F8
MNSVIIGNTGFVGSNLCQQTKFDIEINSKNIGDITGGNFDTIVCAGVSAIKWKANQDPSADLLGIKKLTDVLKTVTAKQFVLISTVDVFSDPNGKTEASKVETEGLHPYGLHRFNLERELSNHFPACHILRLPALFGSNLKKNILFDLAHKNMLEKINPASSFQWYPLNRLWSDICSMTDAQLPLVHLAVEPIATSKILSEFFADVEVGSDAAPVAHYNFHTQFAEHFGGVSPYIMPSQKVLAEIGKWVSENK